MAEIETEHAKEVDEDAKILALKSNMPETLFGEAGVFRGKSFNLYVDLRTIIVEYLDDEVPVSMMKQGSSISTTNMVKTSGTVDQGEEGEDEGMKNDSPWSSSSSGKVKEKAKSK